MKKRYLKPTIIIQKIELATLAGRYQSFSPLPILNPLFRLCCS
jgi:hypothetical protein